MRFLIIINLLAMSLIFVDFPESNSLQLKSKIVGGAFALNGTMTYMASVKNIENEHVCGGCLISGTHVLTVAHCIVYYKKILYPKYDGIYVVVGTHNISEEGLRRNIKHLDCSEEFYWPNDEDIIGDIGLITLSRGVDLMPRKVSYLKLPKSEVHIKTFGLVSGWGDTIFSNGETSEPSGMLKYLIVEIKNVNECRQDLIHSNYEKVLCVYPSLNGTKLAKGDSGNPLVSHETVIGVQSCSSDEFGPSIFTYIYKYLKYIEEAKYRAARNIELDLVHC